MKHDPTGGASRPRRRRVLQLGALLASALVLVIAIRETDALVSDDHWDEPRGQLNQPDTAYARQLIAAVRGANGILCGAIDRAFDTGYWSHSFSSVIETDFADAASAEVARWVGKRRFPEGVLPLARAALISDDACVRRVGARIAGNTTVTDLHDRLRAELNAADARTRVAALFALGFADKAGALTAVRARLEDGDRNVRVAAIWALGQIGDETSTATMVQLLERDTDPVVRSAAAWALGRIND